MMAPGAAHAQAFITGSQLAHACASHAPRDESACDGYIAGALDTVVTTPALKATLCPPPHVKLSALREALGHYGEQKPDDAKGSGLALIQAMLKANYPCPAK
jgi:hypothetical protein